MGFFDRKVEVKLSDKQVVDAIESLMYQSPNTPKIIESSYQDWTLFGPHNSFPLELLELRNSSGIHSSIIDAKTKLISGNGVIFGSTREESNNYISTNFKSIPFYNKVDKVFYQVTKDQMTFGYSCYEIIYSIDRTKIVDINWIDAARIGCGKSEDGKPSKDYYYSSNWKDIRKNVPVKISEYNPVGDDRRELVFIKYNENNMDYFALPSYYSALKWIKADAMMADYNLSALTNGFSPSIVFKFYKKPTPEERSIISSSIKGNNAGVNNAGKALIFFSDGKELAPDIQTLDATNIDSRLLTLSDQIVQQIISAHRANPSLLGIAIPGKLGYSQELVNSWNIFNAQVIIPERKLILDAFRSMFVYNGVTNVNIEVIDLGLA